MTGHATASSLTRQASDGATCVLDDHLPAFDLWPLTGLDLQFLSILFPSVGSEVTTLDLWPPCDL